MLVYSIQYTNVSSLRIYAMNMEFVTQYINASSVRLYMLVYPMCTFVYCILYMYTFVYNMRALVYCTQYTNVHSIRMYPWDTSICIRIPHKFVSRTLCHEHHIECVYSYTVYIRILCHELLVYQHMHSYTS